MKIKDTSVYRAPSRTAALDQLNHFVPIAGKPYADKRNHDLGAGNHHAVSRLSPWLRHRLISEQEVVSAVLSAHSVKAADKFIQEVFWRSYWKGWLEMRPQVWQQYQKDLQRLYTDEVFNESQKILQHGSGIDCFDHWLQELVETGYLHNHARMWFASIWVFTLKLPWQLGADFFLQHLLDGDPASNTLSWRWVAGLQTKGKAYAATAENIARFTNGRFNPTGQLNETVEALAESVGFEKHDLPDNDGRENVDHESNGTTGLILHEDDLHPQMLAESGRYQSVICIQVCGLLSPGGVSDKVSDFTGRCINSTISDPMVAAENITCTDAEGIDESARRIVEWARDEKLQSVVWAYAPTGPAADVLNAVAVRESLRECGISSTSVQKRWDSIVWPHAGKGFFALKKQIPKILKEIYSQHEC